MPVRPPPAVPGWALARPRLLRTLAAAPCPLIVLRAGAGYGKSVLAAQWAAARGGTRWWRPPPPGSPPGREDPPAWSADGGDLVLDGYPRGDGRLDARVLALLEDPPEGSRLLVLARAEPELELPRRRVESAVLELGPDDLAFEPEEARALYRAATGSEPDEGWLERLAALTLGWPAAVRLAVLESLRGRDALSSAGASGPVAEYLEAEVWRPLAPAQRDLALAAAVLGEPRPESCDELLGASGSAAALRELCRTESWLLPPRRAGEGYRLHPLVRRFVLARLDDEPARRRELADRASGIPGGAPWLEPPGPASPARPIRLRLLGGPSLEGPEGEAPRLRPQALRVLAFLALRRGATVHPERLIDALWPGRAAEMRPTLQTLVWGLRRALHERVVATRPGGYAFDPDGRVWTDVEEFGRLQDLGRLEESLGLYRGELLPGVDWADVERRHLEERYLGTLERLADERLEQGRLEGGIDLLERLLALDPLAEGAHRKLVDAHRRAGREDAARRLQRRFAGRLERELDPLA